MTYKHTRQNKREEEEETGKKSPKEDIHSKTQNVKLKISQMF